MIGGFVNVGVVEKGVCGSCIFFVFVWWDLDGVWFMLGIGGGGFVIGFNDVVSVKWVVFFMFLYRCFVEDIVIVWLDDLLVWRCLDFNCICVMEW